VGPRHGRVLSGDPCDAHALRSAQRRVGVVVPSRFTQLAAVTMRPGQQNKQRMRGRNSNNNNNNGGNNNGNRKGPNPLTRSYESNGPDVKVRGTALHVAEKYIQLSRDAFASGDYVMGENYQQHAEHYYRIIAAAQGQMQPPPSFNRDEDEDDSREPRFNGRQAQQPMSGEQPQPFLDEPFGRHAEERPSEGRSYEGRSYEGRSAEGRSTAEARQPEGRQFESRSPDSRPSDGRQAEGRPSEGRLPRFIEQPVQVPAAVEADEDAAEGRDPANADQAGRPRRRRMSRSRGRARGEGSPEGGEQENFDRPVGGEAAEVTAGE